MPWKITLSSDALQFLSDLDKSEARRIGKKLEQTAENPQHFLEHLAGHEDYKLRVGDYRLVVLLLHNENTIFIEKIGHRKNIYKKF